MATLTPNLNLLLPGLGEFRNSWHIPINANFTKLDTEIGALKLEMTNARFGQSTLKAFLEIAHNSDGSLKPTAEVQSARNSYLFGHKDGLSAFDLRTLSLKRDKEMWKARAASSDLRDALAFRSSISLNMVISGAKNANGYPTWAGFTGDKVQINGSLSPIYLLIDGQISRIRKLEEVTLSGGAGTYYIYADYQADGVLITSAIDGAITTDVNSEVRVHNASADFSLLGVQAGDLLRYTNANPVQGDYLIEQVAPESNPNRLLIKGLFPGAGFGALAYEVRDPLGATFGFAATETPAAGRIFIAEADFDGVAVTAVRARHFKDSFVGEWRAVDVSTGSGNFEEIWNHNLGTDRLEVTIQVSQANDGSQPIETLSVGQFNNSLAVSTGIGTLAATGALGTLAATGSVGTLTTQTADSHVHTVTGAPAVSLSGAPTVGLSGTPSAALTGDVTPRGNALMKYTRNRLFLKNAANAVFYRDYDGIDRQTGFIRVILTKKG